MGITERKQREKKRREKEILKSARKEFWEHGYRNTSMKGIAQKAELSAGTLYLYFKNKEDLFAALSIEMLQSLFEQNREVVSEKQMPVKEKLAALREIFLNLYDYDSKSLTYLFHLQSADNFSRLSPEILAKIKDLSSKSHKDLTSLVQDGMDQGLFCKGHPVAIADTLWGIFSGVALWSESKRRLNPEKNFVKTTLRTAMDIFFKGLKSA